MHWTFWTILVLCGWALTAVKERRVALFLVLGWVVGQLWWMYTGDSIPRYLYYTTDMYVVVCAFLYWEKRTQVLDGLIVLATAFSWVIYESALNDVIQWWILTYLIMFQLLLAGPWLKLHDSFKSCET